MRFEAPEMIVVMFESADIITTSEDRTGDTEL